MPIATPTPGRIVMVDFKNERGDLVTRPAICTRTWGDSQAVQLTVLPRRQQRREGRELRHLVRDAARQRGRAPGEPLLLAAARLTTLPSRRLR
jgi:hypothetical protein